MEVSGGRDTRRWLLVAAGARGWPEQNAALVSNRYVGVVGAFVGLPGQTGRGRLPACRPGTTSWCAALLGEVAP
jgi:hypothetical protein